MICPRCEKNISYYESFEIVEGKRVHVECVKE